MNFTIFMLFITWQICSRVAFVRAFSENVEEKCPFAQTVNLTDLKMFENNNYVYQGIIIPPEKQQYYDHVEQFLGDKIKVPWHLRGCACDKKPCTKLCCPRDQYYDDTKNTSQCEKIKWHMRISWDMPIQMEKSNSKEVDIFRHFTTQVGLPCRQPKALDPEDNGVMQEDGTLFIQGDDARLTTRDYCYSPRYDSKSDEYILTPFSCPMHFEFNWKQKLNTYAMAVSIAFLIPTIVVYLAIKELRSNFNGKLLVCYLISLTMGYGIIVFINVSGMRFNLITCSLLGFTCYFFFMAAFLWLSVMCFDMWLHFKETVIETDPRENMKHFVIYSLYAWLIAGLATVIVFCIQISPNVDDIYKPGIGDRICWLNTDKWSASIYFYGPNLIILLFNMTTFAYLTSTIYSIRRDLAKMTQKEKFFQENAIVILRLFLVMGISWIFDILSYCVREYKDWDFIFIISDFVNAIQGISIFSLFVLKPNILNILKKKFQKHKIGKSVGSISSGGTTFSKLQVSTSATTAV